ncbi:MAG: CAP domain-containing protein [Enterocloster asparagiformis]|nr:CAP domain-containing protein [Enterocloster asparagiformis]
MKKMFKALLATAAFTVVTAFTSFAGQWQQDGNGWWWQNDDGTYPEWTWAWIDGDHDGIAENYYFDENGYLCTTTDIPGVVVNQDGAMMENGAVVTAQLPAGRDWYPGAAINGKLFIAEFDRSEVDAQDAAAEAEREARRQAMEPIDEEIDPYEVADRIVELVNEERAKKGKDALAINDELMENAMLRAEEAMHAKDGEEHTRPDGSACFTAITVNYITAAENIAYVPGHTVEQLAEYAVEGWIKSPGHHVNMIQSKWEETGVGVWVEESATGPVICAVQLFIK